jgi:hypothetical protein
VYIPKADGRERPSTRSTRRTFGILLRLPTGTQPDALAVGLTRGKVDWVLDADICGFFDVISHEGMRKFLQHGLGIAAFCG